jgi:5'-3' exonuclease
MRCDDRHMRLTPRHLRALLLRSPIKDFYPLDFKIDFEGKRNEWEGVVQARGPAA